MTAWFILQNSSLFSLSAPQVIAVMAKTRPKPRGRGQDYEVDAEAEAKNNYEKSTE